MTSSIDRNQALGKIFDLGERRAEFIKEITRYVGERRATERLTRQQLGQLDGLRRIQAQRQSLLDNAAHYYAHHPQADVALGVLVVITFYSDNDDGACTLSIPRMARFLSRSERAVHDALRRLEASNTVLVERKPGRPSWLTPWVHSPFGSMQDALIWLLDARSPSRERGWPGRPRKDRSTIITTPLTQSSPQLSRNTHAVNITPISEIVRNSPEGEHITPLKPSSSNTTSNTTEGENDGYRDRFSAAFDISDDHSQKFNRIFNNWGQEPGTAHSQQDRVSTDRLLAGALEAFSGTDSETLRQAFTHSLNTIDAKQVDAGTNRKGGAAALSYFTQTMATTVDRLRLAAAKLEAEARIVQAVQRERLMRGLANVERGSSRRAQRRPSMDDTMAQAFQAEE